MRIDAIRLRNVRRFGSEGIAIDDLDPGINVLTAPNEFGKSTLLDALRFALFIKDSSREQKTAGSLRSYGVAADPYVEIDFRAAGADFRLAKRFAEGRKDSMTKLAEVPGGQTLLGDDADDRIRQLLGAEKLQSGPSGLLWVGQGESLRSIVTSDKTLATAEQAETMSGLLSQEVSAVSGSDQARKVSASAADALKELETPKSQKATGKLLEAQKQVEALKAFLSDAEERVGRSSRLRTELSAKRSELATLEDREDAARRRAEREQAVKKAQDGPRLRAERGHTEERIAVDTRERARLQEDLQSLLAAAKRLTELVNSESMAAEKAASLSEQRGMAEADRIRAREARARAGEDVSSLRQMLETWRRIAESERAADDRQRLAADLAAAQEALAKLPELEADAERGPIDLPALREAQQRIDQAEARLSAASPELRVEAGGPVDVDGHALAAGQQAKITGEGRITVGDTEMTLSLPGRETLIEALRSAQARKDRLLSETNVTSLPEAEDIEHRRVRAGELLEDLRRDIARRAPEGVDALKARIAALEGKTATEAAPELDAAEVEAKLAEAETLERRSAAEEEALSKRLDALTDERAEAASDLEILRRERAALSDRLGPDEEQAAQRKELENAIEAAAGRLAGHQHHLQELEQALREVKRAEQEAERLRKADENDRRRADLLGKDIVRIETELKTLYADGAEAQAESLRQELGVSEEELSRLEERRAGLRLLLDLIAEEEETRRETIVAPVMKVLDPMLEQLFGDARLRFDSEWNAESLSRPGEPDDVTALSAGTREQLAILTRLAFARLMAEQGKPVPVILDDALGYADDLRARKLFGILHEVAEETQVIVLTCHDRLFRDLGGHRIEPRPFQET